MDQLQESCSAGVCNPRFGFPAFTTKLTEGTVERGQVGLVYWDTHGQLLFAHSNNALGVKVAKTVMPNL